MQTSKSLMRDPILAVMTVVAAFCSTPAVMGDVMLEETRRQIGSRTIESVYNLTGNGMRLGQVEKKVPYPHAAVTFTAVDPNDVGATPNRGDHPTEVAGVMVCTDPNPPVGKTGHGMARNASLFSDGDLNNPSTGNEELFTAVTNVLSATTGAGNKLHALNMSYCGIGDPDGASSITRAMDYSIVSSDYLFIKSSGNDGPGDVTVPGDSFNGMAVGNAEQSGATSHQGPINSRLDQLNDSSSRVTDIATHPKPDLVAPGTRILMPSDEDWDAGTGKYTGFDGRWSGTSYAAPHVTGVAAQLYQLQSTSNHRTMKAVVMNAADKTVRHDGTDAHAPWAAGQHGLDAQLGTGQLNAWGSAVTLAADAGGRIGESTGGAAPGGGVGQSFNPVGPDTRVVATVAWDRKVTDKGAGEPFDSRYEVAAAGDQPHMRLSFEGPATFEQNTAGGSVQHINVVTAPAQAGDYTLWVRNNGGGGLAHYTVAWAVSPVDKNPGEQSVAFTVSDQVHEQGGNDRIREGRAGTTIRGDANADATKAAVGVESDIYLTDMKVANTRLYDGKTQLGIQEVAAYVDDAVNALSFGRDDLQTLTNEGGQVYFSVDEYATGLSHYGLANKSPNAVLAEATVVAEAAGDIFLSKKLLPGAAPIQNANLGRKNTPNTDFLHPQGGDNINASFADSYYMGQTGPRPADNEDDLNGLEGLGSRRVDDELKLVLGYVFFSLDRNSPSAHTADVLVSDMKGNYRVYASADNLGLLSTDNLDALLLMDIHEGAGWPTYDPLMDRIVFSVDRDSKGKPGSAVQAEATQGEVPGDLFWGSTDATNMLFLEATDLGLQEIPLGANMSWLSDNLDALDFPDVVPEPATLVLLAMGGMTVLRRRSRRA